jgi:hypothetical protein
MSHADDELGRGEHPPEAHDDASVTKLEDLDTSEQQAAEVNGGGHHPLPAGWNQVLNIQGGG